jgi:hypothetical protein
LDEDLRKLIEIARLDAEYALQELRYFGLARVDVAETHIASLVACLDQILLKADKAIARKPPAVRH